MKARQIISLLLAVLMLVILFAGCSSKEAESKNESGQISGTNENSQPNALDIPDVNYNGAEFIILTTYTDLSDLKFSEFGYGELEENTINDAVEKRNAKVEEMLGVTIKETALQGGQWFNDPIQVEIARAFESGDTYHMVAPSLFQAAALAQDNYFYNLMDLKYLHGLENEWWDDFFVDEITINNKLYFITGDIGFKSRNSVIACYFNKNMFSKYDLPDPYNMVKEKTWTFDKLIEWSKLVKSDDNNDGKIDYQDSFGIGGQLDLMWAMFYGSGEKIATKNNEGIPELSIYNSRSTSVVSKILELMQNKDYFVSANDYFSVTDKPVYLISDAFIEERSLFFIEALDLVEELRDMAAETDFGILPIPLYDTNQESYHSMINPWGSACYAIPKQLNAEDAEMASIVMETLGWAGLEILKPAYYDVALKSQKTRDEESAEMLDLIFDTISCDMGHVYNWGSMGGLLHNIVKLPAGSFTSEYQKVEQVAKGEIQATVDKFASLD